MRRVLAETAHRPYPLPVGRWVMRQTWSRLLFAHWRVPPSAVRPLVPDRLSIDTRDGSAWVGVVPFAMRHVRPRVGFDVPGLSAFPELNVRTYVTAGGKSGVWFFSLDAARRVPVWLGRRWFRLPYFRARMTCRREGDTVVYRSERLEPPAARFRARYRPVSEVFQAEPGSLDRFLTERYCLYAADRRGRIHCGDIHHLPWPLQRAEAQIEECTMAEAAGLALSDAPPLLHYADRLDVAIWPLCGVA